MDILYVSNLYPPSIGGAQVHLHQLAKTVRRTGNNVNVLTMTNRSRKDWLRLSTVCSERESRHEYEGIDVWRIGFTGKTRLRMAPWALAYYALMKTSVRRISSLIAPYLEQGTPVPSIVHASRIGREFLVRAALDFAHRRDVPFVLTPNHHARWKGFLYREYCRVYREADAVIALTPFEKRILATDCGVREERIHVLGVGPLLSETFSEESFRSAHGVKGRFVLFLGQQLPYKGIGSILRSAPRVWKDHPDVFFVFVGPRTPYSRALFRTVKDPRIVDVGPVDLEMKTAALSSCELLCVPSTQESFGGVFLEAWSLGKPVIGGRIGAVASVIEDGEDGLLSSQEPGELARLISSLLSAPEECRAMGAMGRRKTREKYSWEAIGEKTLEIYQALLGGSHGRTGPEIAP